MLSAGGQIITDFMGFAGGGQYQLSIRVRTRRWFRGGRGDRVIKGVGLDL